MRVVIRMFLPSQMSLLLLLLVGCCMCVSFFFFFFFFLCMIWTLYKIQQTNKNYVLFEIQAMKAAILFFDGVNIARSYLSHDQ